MMLAPCLSCEAKGNADIIIIFWLNSWQVSCIPVQVMEEEHAKVLAGGPKLQVNGCHVEGGEGIFGSSSDGVEEVHDETGQEPRIQRLAFDNVKLESLQLLYLTVEK